MHTRNEDMMSEAEQEHLVLHDAINNVVALNGTVRPLCMSQVVHACMAAVWPGWHVIVVY